MTDREPPMPSDDVSHASAELTGKEMDIRAGSVKWLRRQIYGELESFVRAKLRGEESHAEDCRWAATKILDELCRRATAPAATGEPVAWALRRASGDLAEPAYTNESQALGALDRANRMGFDRPYQLVPLYTAPPSPSSLPAIPERAVLRKGWTLLVGGGFDSTEELSRRGALSDDPSVEVLLVRADAVRVTPSVEPQREGR